MSLRSERLNAPKPFSTAYQINRLEGCRRTNLLPISKRSLRDSVSVVSSPRSFGSPPRGGLGEARLPLSILSEFPKPPLWQEAISGGAYKSSTRHEQVKKCLLTTLFMAESLVNGLYSCPCPEHPHVTRNCPIAQIVMATHQLPTHLNAVDNL